jgi:hypothetical protein
MSLSLLFLLFLSLKKYVFRNELRGATTPQARIGLLTKGSALLFYYSEPVKPFARLTTKEEMGNLTPSSLILLPQGEKAKRESVCAVVPE